MKIPAPFYHKIIHFARSNPFSSNVIIPFFIIHIFNILKLRSCPEMIWIKARRIIAPVTDILFAVYIKSQKYIGRYPMNQIITIVNRHIPIKLSPFYCCSSTYPFPATKRINISILKKTFFYFFYVLKRKSISFWMRCSNSFSSSYPRVMHVTHLSCTSFPLAPINQALYNIFASHNAILPSCKFSYKTV